MPRPCFISTFFCVFATGLAPLSAYEPDLWEAAILGDLTEIERALDAGDGLEDRDPEFGLTALQLAMIYGREEVVALLKERVPTKDLPLPDPGTTLKKYLGHHIDPASPGATVLVAKSGKILFEDAFGAADLKKGTPLSRNSLFPVGSLTKQFTSVATLLLADDRKISLDDNVQHFLPEFPNGQRILIQQLLNHTAGLPNYTAFKDFPETIQQENFSKQVLIERIGREGLAFDPGTNWDYSNSGYLLLEEIIRKAAGTSYLQLLRQRIFQKASIQAIEKFRPGLLTGRLVSGYVGGNNTWRKTDPTHQLLAAGGAGELCATAEELYRWNEVIFGGGILQPSTLSLALTPTSVPSDSVISEIGSKYGFGWIIDDVRGLKRYSHGGGLSGYTSLLIRFADSQTTIVVLSNGGNLSCSRIASAAYNLFLWNEMQSQPSFRHDTSMTSKDLTGYAGIYPIKGFGDLRIRTEGESISSKLANQPWQKMVALARDHFSLPDLQADFFFERNSRGNVGSVRIEQKGAKLIGLRIQK